MGDQRRPLQPGEPAPSFALPAVNLEGTVSLASLRGRPFLIGFFRGLHCPFCRRQVFAMAVAVVEAHDRGLRAIARIGVSKDGVMRRWLKQNER